MAVGTFTFSDQFFDCTYSFEILPATRVMLGLLFGSTSTHSSARRISFAAASTGYESPSLRSIHCLSLPSASTPSTASLAVSIIDVLIKSPFALSYLRFARISHP